MKAFTDLSFDRGECLKEAFQLRDLLAANPALDESKDILPFFRSRPHLSALCGCYHPQVKRFDRVAWEYDLFGDFSCDVAVGDSVTKACCFLEFEDAGPRSLFVQQGRRRRGSGRPASTTAARRSSTGSTSSTTAATATSTRPASASVPSTSRASSSPAAARTCGPTRLCAWSGAGSTLSSTRKESSASPSTNCWRISSIAWATTHGPPNHRGRQPGRRRRSHGARRTPDPLPPRPGRGASGPHHFGGGS
jgi:hypothetical protein